MTGNVMQVGKCCLVILILVGLGCDVEVSVPAYIGNDLCSQDKLEYLSVLGVPERLEVVLWYDDVYRPPGETWTVFFYGDTRVWFLAENGECDSSFNWE